MAQQPTAPIVDVTKLKTRQQQEEEKLQQKEKLDEQRRKANKELFSYLASIADGNDLTDNADGKKLEDAVYTNEAELGKLLNAIKAQKALELAAGVKKTVSEVDDSTPNPTPTARVVLTVLKKVALKRKQEQDEASKVTKDLGEALRLRDIAQRDLITKLSEAQKLAASATVARDEKDKENQRLTEEIKNSKEAHEATKKELEALKESNANLDTRCRDETAEKTRVTREKTQAEATITVLKKEKEELEKQLDAARGKAASDVQSLQAEKEKLEKQLTAESAALRAVESAAQAFQQEKQALENQVQQQAKELDAVRDALKQAQSREFQLQAKLTATEKELDAFKQASTGNVSALTTNLSNANAKIAALEKDKQTLQAQVQAKNDEITRLNDLNSKLQTDYAKLQSDNGKLGQEIAALRAANAVVVVQPAPAQPAPVVAAAAGPDRRVATLQAELDREKAKSAALEGQVKQRDDELARLYARGDPARRQETLLATIQYYQPTLVNSGSQTRLVSPNLHGTARLRSIKEAADESIKAIESRVEQLRDSLARTLSQGIWTSDNLTRAWQLLGQIMTEYGGSFSHDTYDDRLLTWTFTSLEDAKSVENLLAGLGLQPSLEPLGNAILKNTSVRGYFSAGINIEAQVQLLSIRRLNTTLGREEWARGKLLALLNDTTDARPRPEKIALFVAGLYRAKNRASVQQANKNGQAGYDITFESTNAGWERLEAAKSLLDQISQHNIVTKSVLLDTPHSLFIVA